jgi:hypothetical protein
MGGCEEESVGRKPPFREDSTAEAEESSLLEAVIRERLLKTQQSREVLAGATAICELWTLAVAL